jgi:hypothetical protein
MSLNRKKQNRLIFSLFVFCFIFIPAVLLVTGINYLRQQADENLLRHNQEELSRFYKNLQTFSDGQQFWCHHLTTEIDYNLLGKNSSETAENIHKKIIDLRKDLKFNYLVFQPSMGISTASIEIEPKEKWLTALKVFQRRLRRGRDPRDPTVEEQKAIGEVFGPQTNLKHLYSSYEERRFLVWTDSTFKKPLLWTRCINDVLVVVFIDYDQLGAVDGILSSLKSFSSKSDNKFKFALKNGPEYQLIDPEDKKYNKQLEQALTEHVKNKSFKIETENLFIFPKFIRTELVVLGFFDKSLTRANTNWAHISVIFFFIVLSFYIGRYAYRIFILEVPDSLSLRWKLRFLFFFANGLPLLVLFFLGTDYLNQKKDTLLQETLGRGTAYLQTFDESFESEYAKILINKKFAEEQFIKRVQNQEINREIIQELVKNIGDYEKKVLIIASRSEVLGTEFGIYDPKNGLYPDDYNSKSSQSKSQLDFTRKIGHYFIDSVNGIKISGKIATEIEILVESITQKPVVNFIFDMMQRRGNFSQWGFGENVHPAIIDTFTLGHTKTEDFFFIAMFRKEKFQLSFMKRSIPRANRNNLGLKVVAIKDSEASVPLEAFKNKDLTQFASTLSSFPGDEIKFVDYKGEQHLAMGFNGNSLTEYRLIGLYPVSRIENLIARQKRQLSIFALLSLLLTFALSQILAHSFLMPLNHLSFGAKAIEDKHFHHRLPPMSHDEFGKMGEIFNEVMVDLEELSVASAIQEQLLPQTSIATGNFSLYGKSESMGELGGDYFDFLELDDQHFSVLLGDVAGHGVGAALIMAMAKAGIIQSENLLNRPLELVSRLHGLIHASKTKKQKKIMTFQYLYLDSVNGTGIYSNAGACSPIIIRKAENRVEELKLPGAALGAFKKAKYSEIEISFAPGDAIVFYTDGIVEARGDNDEEMGYDELKRLLLRSWDLNAEKFYRNIYQEYLKHLGSQSAQDDLTMVVLVYTANENSLADEADGNQKKEMS